MALWEGEGCLLAPRSWLEPPAARAGLGEQAPCPSCPCHTRGWLLSLHGIPRSAPGNFQMSRSRSGWRPLPGRPGSAIWAHSQVCLSTPPFIQQTLSAYGVQGTGQRAMNNDRGLELRDFKYSRGDNFKRARKMGAKGSGHELT